MDKDRAKNPTTATGRVLKAMSVFGGIQVITILCSVVRTKLVAVWIGPAGVGLITLYNATIDMLSQTSQLNLRQSAVRDISAGRSEDRLPRVVAVVRSLALYLGIGGALLCAVLSPLLSRWTFGDGEHTAAFIVLSLVVLFTSLAAGEQAVMQGLEHLKNIARSTLWAALVSTAAALLLFYFLRIDGIVPVLLAFGLFTFLFARLNRVNPPGPQSPLPGVAQAFREGRRMLSLGMYMTVSSFVSLLAAYLFAVYLNRHYSDSTVGIYQSGFTLVNTYVGVIFTAISMEYFPRLSSVAMRPKLASVLVSHEIRVTLWALLPLVVCFICASGLIVHILYTSSFMSMVPYISIAVTGTFMRAVSWCMAFAILARGDGRSFILTESVSAAVMLVLNVIFFSRMDFMGLGIAYVIWYLVYALVVYFAAFRGKYGMSLRPGILRLAATVFGASLVTLALRELLGPWLAAAITIPPAIYSSCTALLRPRKK